MGSTLEDEPIIPPPSTVTVFDEPPRALLFTHDGVALWKRKIGF